MAQTNEIIESFLKHYEQGYDFYYNLAKLAEEQCEKMLSKDIRAIITSRAKKSKSLKEKIYQRHKIKNYQSEQDIREDIVDLAGVRVALYFPADRKKVESFLRDTFIIGKENLFPSSQNTNEAVNTKNKFDGYHAEHYRVKLKEESLKDLKYANHIIEIQVASILMHAWAEVNHDLAYKPSSGDLSQQELSILDGLNGLLLTGEVLLEQLQSAFQERVAHQKEPFANQYELAVFVSERLKKSRGEVSFIYKEDFGLLLNVLDELSQDTPDYVDDLLNNMDKDIYSIAVSHQVFGVIFERNINHFDIFYDLAVNDDDEIANHDLIKGNLKVILVKLILFNRYIRYLVYLYDIQYCLLLQQIGVLGELLHVTFPMIYSRTSIKEVSMSIANTYDCVYRDLGRKKYNISEIDKEITEILNCFEHIGHPDSRKAMEWARSGKSELPEK